MAFVRKVPLKKLQPPVKTFYDVATALTSMVTKAGQNSDEIYIVFDTYRENCIKNGKRERRGKSKDMIVLDRVSPKQKVPIELEQFWSSSVSKTAFHAFCVEWLITNYKDTKPLYPGISTPAWIVSAAGCTSPFPRLNCTHEETDDRMMLHIEDILCPRKGPSSLTLSSGDTDVFVCRLYHIADNWRHLSLQDFWLVRNSGGKRSILPLHNIHKPLGADHWCQWSTCEVLWWYL